VNENSLLQTPRMTLAAAVQIGFLQFFLYYMEFTSQAKEILKKMKNKNIPKNSCRN